MMKKFMMMLLALCLMLTVAACGAQGTASSLTTVTTQTGADAAVERVMLDENVTYFADIEIADYGTITVQLDQTAAPITAANFVFLAKNGFYDGLTFHRIINGYMMQGGAPKSVGDMADSIKGEFAANGYMNPLSHEYGVTSMARAQSYDSANSQFFIMHRDEPRLDGKYAAFGRVTEGLEIVDAVCTASKPVDNDGSIAAENQPVIVSITIREE